MNFKTMLVEQSRTLTKWMVHQEPAAFASVLHAAARTGFAGFFAMVLQVTLLMWIRTCMNYQYKHGGSLKAAFKVLYAQGGIKRFYSGYSVAVVQAPIGRFFDTAANSGVLALFLLYPAFDNVPTFVKTMAASATAASFKMLLIPMDALKTMMQVEGTAGTRILRAKLKEHGVLALWDGATVAVLSMMSTHYPWYLSFNYLNSTIPAEINPWRKLIRSAFIGFICTGLADGIANSFKVIKTLRQTRTNRLSYSELIHREVDKDGWFGFLTRGLKTKLLTNAISGIAFTVAWQFLQEWMDPSWQR